MRFTIKQFAALTAGTVTLGLGVGAYAFFTQPGSGDGAASVGASSAIQLTASTSAAIYPGAPGIDVTIDVKNAGKGAQQVGAVSLTSIDTPSGCTASAFSMAPASVNTTLAPGASTTVHGTLVMADSGNQDLCQLGALTLHLASN